MEINDDQFRISPGRLKDYDFSSGNLHLITICTKECSYYFGEIAETLHATSLLKAMSLIQSNSDLHSLSLLPTGAGKTAFKHWIEIPNHFPFTLLDEFSVLPNHIHGILLIEKTDKKNITETLHATSLMSKFMSAISPKYGSISSVIRSYKSSVTKKCNENNFEFEWHPRFHNHTIKSEKELDKIRQKIIDNSLNWKDDKFFKK